MCHCKTWNKRSFTDSSGHVFTFGGSCLYLLSGDKDGAYAVYLNQDTTSDVFALIMLNGRHVISLVKDRTVYEGRTIQALPFTTLTMTGDANSVTIHASTVGLTLVWDRATGLTLSLVDGFLIETCGLCKVGIDVSTATPKSALERGLHLDDRCLVCCCVWKAPCHLHDTAGSPARLLSRRPHCTTLSASGLLK